MDNKEYAGFWIRCGAVLIDMVVMFIVFILPLSIIYGEDYWTGSKMIYGFWDVMLNYIMPLIATIWFWLRFLGTPGKMATKLKIVDATTGNKMRLGQAIGRYFAYIVSTLPLGLGFIWIGIDKRKQGWHDKLAGTVVLRHKSEE
ncbi:RDD family protein [Rheinheimera maricola]|uniref:RDD family protein n=1 Tax=Rheinheimera maricola TaxID=2793282 RepID=A0ABS7XBI2_9GAMM|nr:RDD family protein [Rheinheimera maricola]MBZ9612918.1 RDD family protein [Rheinheimera maricola]